MKKICCLLFVASLAFTSCQKEIDYLDDEPGSDNTNNDGDSSATSIVGTYNFLSVAAQTQSDAMLDILGGESKTSSLFDFVSTNNTGTVVFTDDEMTVTGLSYTATGNLKAYTYQNNVLIDSTEEQPFSYDVTASNSSGKYKLAGADSIYFPDGGFISIAGASSVPVSSSGGKISFKGDTLRITTPIYSDTTLSISGLTYHVVQSGTGTISLEKK